MISKKIKLSIAALGAITGGVLSAGAQAQAAEMLQDKLDGYKAEFSKKAPAELSRQFEEGVNMVGESGALERAVNTGDNAPDFTLPNAAGDNISLTDLLKTGPVVLIWYRGEWCPYCNIQLEDIQAHMPQFNDAGAHVVAISPEKPDRGWDLKSRQNLEFHVLSDDQSKIAEKYGVIYKLPPIVAKTLQEKFDIHDANNDERDLLPLAASYVINQNGVITYAYLDKDYRKRAETSTLVEEVKKLKR